MPDLAGRFFAGRAQIYEAYVDPICVQPAEDRPQRQVQGKFREAVNGCLRHPLYISVNHVPGTRSREKLSCSIINFLPFPRPEYIILIKNTTVQSRADSVEMCDERLLLITFVKVNLFLTAGIWLLQET